MVYSLALTDHYFSVQILQQIGAVLPEKGVPNLPPEQEKELLAVVRDPRIRRIVPHCAPERSVIQRKTNFIKRWLSRRTHG